MVETLLSLLVVGAVVVWLVQPLFSVVNEPEVDAARTELEDAKQAKYREIRDAELERAAGRLTAAQFEEIDRELRREALALVAKLDTLGGSRPKPRPAEADPR